MSRLGLAGGDRRTINFGGVSSTVSRNQALESAKALRNQRDSDRRRNSSAKKIQRWWRGIHRIQETTKQLAAVCDKDPTEIDGSRALLLLPKDNTRLTKWSVAMTANENASLLQTCVSPEISSWEVIFKRITVRLFRKATDDPTSLDSLFYLQFLDALLVSTDICQSLKQIRENVMQFLLEHGFYGILSKVIVQIPQEQKSSIPFSHLISLLHSPMRTFSASPTSHSYISCLRSILTQVLTIPSLPSRLPIASLTELSAGVVHLNLLSPSMTELVAELNVLSKIHLLANLMVLAPPRYKKLSASTFVAYCTLLAGLVDGIPEVVLGKPASEASWSIHSDEALDGMDMNIDPTTRKRLLTLCSTKHVSLLTGIHHTPMPIPLSNCIPSICFSWPSQRNQVLNSIISIGGNSHVRAIYKEWVRNSPLGKSGDFKLLLDPAYSSHWPPLVFLAELYVCKISSMNDEEFFTDPPHNLTAHSRCNPLDISEFRAFLRQLMFPTFALDQLGNWSIRKKVAPVIGQALKLDVVKNKLEVCLHSLYARHSRRPSTKPREESNIKFLHDDDDMDPINERKWKELKDAWLSKYIDKEKQLQTTFLVAPEDVKKLSSQVLEKLSKDTLWATGVSERLIYPHRLGNYYIARLEEMQEEHRRWPPNRRDRRWFLAPCMQIICCFEDALDMAWDDYCGKPDILLKLAYMLLWRFDATSKDIEDIKRALDFLEVTMNQDSSLTTRNRIFRIGLQFMENFKFLSNMWDVGESLPGMRGIIYGTSFTPGPGGPTSMQVGKLCQQLVLLGDHVVVQFVVSTLLQMVVHTPEAVDLLGLADWFYLRYQLLKVPADLDEAISVQRIALKYTAGDLDPSFPLTRLTRWLETRYHAQQKERDLVELRELLSEATSPSVNPSHRFQNCIRLSRLPSCTWDPRPFDDAIDALMDISSIGASTRLHEHALRMHDIGTFVNDAVAKAIEAKDLGHALAWLEFGRCLTWDTISSLWDSPIELDDEHRGLGQDLIAFRASEMMRQGMFRKRRRSVTDILDAVQDSPIVILNASGLRCDALIVGPLPRTLRLVKLHDLALKDVLDWRMELHALTSALGLRERHVERYGRPHTPRFDADEKFRNLLGQMWALAIAPVLEAILDMYSPQESKHDLPRIWWCPTGSFASLPIHAAGLYTTYGPQMTLSHFCVPSYIPTLTSYGIARDNRRSKDFRFMVVAQPSTPGAAELPGTTKEVESILKRMHSFPGVFLEGPHATVAEVMKQAKCCSWVHLACHGIQAGFRSKFLLHDGTLRLHKIAEQPTLSHVEFAFLSACQTATGDDQLPDEALHLAGGLHLIGYRSILATMFSIKDDDAPLVADRVYEYLFRDDKPDCTKAARALHAAIKALQEKHGRQSFASWVPFIHMGA